MFFLIQCRTVKINKYIQYVLPHQVELRLLEQLQIKEQPITFFSLQRSGENYVITLVTCTKTELKRIDKLNMVSKTARYLLIGKKFYPLLFDTDYKFGTELKKAAVEIGTEERWRNETFGIPRSHPIYDGYFSLTFSSKGKIHSIN